MIFDSTLTFIFSGTAFIVSLIIFFMIISLRRTVTKIPNNTGINNIIESTMVHLDNKICSLEEKITESNIKNEQTTSTISYINEKYNNQSDFTVKLKENLKILTKAQIILSERLTIMSKKLQDLYKSPKNLQYEKLQYEKDKQILSGHPSSRYADVAIPKLTPTEMTVLRVLATSGPKTASEIREIISKTREHSARLMKKLFLEQYIQRDTITLPYSYKINERIKESIEFSVDQNRK